MVSKRSMFALVMVGVLAGCTGGTDGDTDSGPGSTEIEAAVAPATAGETTVPTAGPSTSSETTTASTTTTSTTTSSTTTSSTTSTTTAPASTAAPTTAPTVREGFEQPPAGLLAPTIDVPSGEFIAAPGDLIAARPGSLEYLPNALSPGNEAPPIRLADFAETPEQGALFAVRDVAGIVNGSLLVGDGESVVAIDAPGSVVGPLATGTHVEISPDGTRLATATEQQLNVFDLATGDGIGIDVDAPDRAILDLEWLDDETLATMTYDSETDTESSYKLGRYDATTLARSSDEISFAPGASIAGRTADGVIGVEVSSSTGAVVRYYDENLVERPELEQTFDSPTPVQFVRIEAGGLGQIWVDEFRLFYLGPGQFEARLLDDVVTQAWFVESAE